MKTDWGRVILHRLISPSTRSEAAYVIFRHKNPHTLLPHQIQYRAQAEALKAVGCGALLVTSSVGVLDEETPLQTPMLVSDLIMPENRMPTGEVCTMFRETEPGQGHLVLDEGLFSLDLNAQVEAMAASESIYLAPPVVFGYAPGPRTKTPAENRVWRRWGAQVNSMSVGPEVVLANELGIPTSALVIGHKRSRSTPNTIKNRQEVHHEISRSLTHSQEVFDRLIKLFLLEGVAVPFRNELYRFPHT